LSLIASNLQVTQQYEFELNRVAPQQLSAALSISQDLPSRWLVFQPTVQLTSMHILDNKAGILQII